MHTLYTSISPSKKVLTRQAQRATLELLRIPRKGLAVKTLLQLQALRNVPDIELYHSTLGNAAGIVEETQVLLVHPNVRNANVVSDHIVSIHRVGELGSEPVSHERIFRHDDSSSTQPRSEGNLHVFAAPDVQSGVHLSLLPPEFGDREHSHGDRRVVVRAGAAAPELTKILVDGSGAG